MRRGSAVTLSAPARPGGEARLGGRPMALLAGRATYIIYFRSGWAAAGWVHWAGRHQGAPPLRGPAPARPGLSRGGVVALGTAGPPC